MKQKKFYFILLAHAYYNCCYIHEINQLLQRVILKGFNPIKFKEYSNH
jgi:hypothetical protein